MADEISEDMVRALFQQEAEEPELLVTITADGLDDPIRATSCEGGLVSRGVEFPYFPFEFAFAGASNDEIAPSATIKIGNTDGEIGRAIRIAEGQPLVTVEAVRVSEPDQVEMAMVGAVLADAEIDGPVVIGSLKPRSFADEPACAARYVIARTPGLF